MKNSTKNTRKVTKPYPNKRRIIDVCIGIFDKNENTPLYVKDIYNRMRQRHWITNGATPHKTVYTKLFMDYRFVRVGPATFQLDKSYYQARMSRAKRA